MPKRKLRQDLLKQRRQIDRAECLRRGRQIQERLLEVGCYRQAGVLALYAPIHNEVDTEALFDAALSDGKTVCFPRVKGHTLEFIAVESAAALCPGAFGIAEPVGAVALAVTDIDLMVVPGVGFDRCGFRLGYGQGYYDRAISVGRPAMLAGLAYDFQLLDQLPSEEHDVCLDMLVTDSAVLQLPGINL